ncbi:MAG TPA: phosphate/phosphite/phosphonate ABC transporter substrate-binding protein [Armatimonadota bacterium]|jgi:phosphonate transport system substrate-binding protein|nr:phosphate/phosphite/phosphonate ABC transporter substrate-binding protein [Armatimonadota bacterium]HOP79257.1 phosphate/phosphite/phosphonate ABC transporter substrate-binding protein [Armatimonadota bacterium]HPP74779.1 phosphate/phosphite/phosphonate ABC transporter substrate-binding protein [Armatimonadota bacterium]
MRLALVIALIAIFLTCVGCSKQQAELGTKENPIKMAMVPSLDTQRLLVSGKQLETLLEKRTGYEFETSVPTTYTAVVEAMSVGKVDVGWLPPLSYVLAHDKYGVEAILVVQRDGSTNYNSVIIARTDSKIDKLEDLKGKKFAYGDVLSTSGYIYPRHLIRTSGYNPDTFFSNAVQLGRHDVVIAAVLNEQVDAGAVYGGPVSDARENLVEVQPDIMKITKIIARSEDIPNDTVSVRKGLPKEMVDKIRDALIDIAESGEGKRIITDLYGIDGLKPAKDSDYDCVRRVAEAEKVDLSKLK